MRQIDIEANDIQNNYTREVEKRSNKRYGTLYASVMIQFLLILSALPVANIVFGIKYYHDVINCGVKLISIPQWLIIMGGAEAGLLLYHALILLSLHENGRTIYGFLVKLFLVPAVCCILFCFSWLVVGSIWFWYDCSTTGFTPVDNMMWCSLILGFVWNLGMTLIFKNL
jgi:hypothetical protein